VPIVACELSIVVPLVTAVRCICLPSHVHNMPVTEHEVWLAVPIREVSSIPIICIRHPRCLGGRVCRWREGQ
jgi:hypothetical protein